MPTEIEENGFKVIIHTRDEHEPPHVHVWKGKGEAIINLGGDKGGYPEVYDVNDFMSDRDASRAWNTSCISQRIFAKEMARDMEKSS